MHKTESVMEKEAYKLLWDFEIQKESRNPGQKTRSSDN